MTYLESLALEHAEARYQDRPARYNRIDSAREDFLAGAACREVEVKGLQAGTDALQREVQFWVNRADSLEGQLTRTRSALSNLLEDVIEVENASSLIEARDALTNGKPKSGAV